MRDQDESPWVISVVGPPAIAAALIFLLCMLPNEVITLLTAWVLGSFPIGVLMGHCVLSEE